MVTRALGEHEITWGQKELQSEARLPEPPPPAPRPATCRPALQDPPPPAPCPPHGGSDLWALVILIEFNCLLRVTLKPFQSPLKLGSIDNTAPPRGFNLCPPQEQ